MKTGLSPAQMISMFIGLAVCIYGGGYFFPELSEKLGSAVFAGITGGAGVALGLSLFEVLKWLKRRS